MTHEFENMLYLFGAAATGKEIDVSRSENLGRIRELAVSQEIWDVIYAALRAKIEDGSIAVPPEIYMRLEKTFLSNVALNIRKTEFNLATIKKLEENGIKCLIRTVNSFPRCILFTFRYDSIRLIKCICTCNFCYIINFAT